MSELRIPLRASFIDCLEPDLNSEINFNLVNSSDKIEIIPDMSEKTYTVVIKDSSDIGYEMSKIQKDNLSRLISISCSLVCDKVAFSPKDKPQSLVGEIKESKEDKDEDEPKVTTTKEENGSETVTVEVPKLTIGFSVSCESTSIAEVDFDESKFLYITKNLLDYNIFESKTERRELNFTESLKEYEFAINSENRYSCFKNLSCSLEKMINKDTEYKRPQFDDEVQRITNANPSEINVFISCYNRQKHTARNRGQKEKLEQCIQDIPQMLPKLKRIVDEVIYKRLP